MTTNSNKTFGVFYSRDSGGRHQTTPPQYVKWACNTAECLGVSFKGKPTDIKHLMKSRQDYDANIFFDFEVEGDRMSRPALNALFELIETSKQKITHVFIPDPDRLSRPNHPNEGIKLEDRFREHGVTIVYKNRIISPSKRGKRDDFGEFIGRAYEFHRSGEFLDRHAEKMVSAKSELAEKGHWAGGRAPYGFRRWLVQESGIQVRQLEDGEIVRQEGHHVDLFPFEAEFEIALRIRKLLRTKRAPEVCRLLDGEGIPSPDHGRSKTINGVKRKVSGKWNPETVNSIGRNDLFVAVTTYGKRSMGKKRRLSPSGPRELNEDEFLPNGRPRVVQNPRALQIKGKARFQTTVDQKEHDSLVEELDRRGGSQRGKRKCQRPEDNPLGGRITDMACGWPMYKTKCQKNKQQTFKYRCGCYDKSKGELCEHNCVDGPAAIEFVLKAIQQRVIQPGVWDKLESKIRSIIQDDHSSDSDDVEKARIASAIAKLDSQIDQAATNMTLAKPKHYEAMAKVYDKLLAEKDNLEDDLKKASQNANNRPIIEDEIQRALATAQRLANADLNNTSDFAMAREVINATNAQFFAKFRKEKWGKKREVNRIAGGVITFGTAPPPVAKYDGPTDREHLKSLAVEAAKRKTAESDGSDSAESLVTGEEAGSLGSKSRADWI